MTDFLGAPSCSSAFIFWNRPVNCSSHGNPPDPLNVIAAAASRPVSPHHREASKDPKENNQKSATPARCDPLRKIDPLAATTTSD